MSNSNFSGPSSGSSTAVGSKFGLADRHEILGLGDLGHAVQQQRAADLVGHVLAKAMFDQLARRTPRPKAGNGGRLHHFAERLVVVALDVLARNRDGDVALAGRRFLHVDRQIQLLRRLVLAQPIGCGNRVGLGLLAQILFPALS